MVACGDQLKMFPATRKVTGGTVRGRATAAVLVAVAATEVTGYGL